MPEKPLAKTALEGLAIQFMCKGRDQGGLHGSHLTNDFFSAEKYDAAEKAYEFSARWGRCALPASSSGSNFKAILANVMNTHAVLCYNCEIPQVERSGISVSDKLENRVYLTRRALSMMENALDLNPSDETIQKNVGIVGEKLTGLEREARFLGLFSEQEDS